MVYQSQTKTILYTLMLSQNADWKWLISTYIYIYRNNNNEKMENVCKKERAL